MGWGAQLGIDARRAKKQQLFAAITVGTVDNIILNLKILIDELCGIGGVGVDAPHLGGGQNHHLRPMLGKKSPHPGLIAQIKFRMGTREQPLIARTCQGAAQGAAHKPPVASHIYQRILAHALLVVTESFKARHLAHGIAHA